MRTQALALLFCLLTAVLSGCAGKDVIPALGREDTEKSRAEVQIQDPQGPIPKPQLPPELHRTPTPTDAGVGKTRYAYTVVCTIQDSGNSEPPEERKDSKAKVEKAAIIDAFEKSSTLFSLKDNPPETRTGLEQRLTAALEDARNVLKSRGYYAGRVRGQIEEPSESSDGKAVAHVTFIPGPQYHMGDTKVAAALPPAGQADVKDVQKARGNLPLTLADAGLAEGAPAAAADVLAAVDRVRERFHENGYPFAQIRSTRYIVDHEKRLLEAQVAVTPGAFARMGPIEIQGDPNVRPAYVEAMRAWPEGRPWRQSHIENMRDSLRQSGLFQKIEIAPADEDNAEGERPVIVTLTGAPERTVSGALKYHSDFGPGVQAAWEHRNLTGRGDSLRFSAPLWMDMQEVTGSYRLPFFLRKDQDFIAKGGFVNQDTDAYRLTSAAGSAGVERRLSRHWSASLQGSAQGGTIKEPDEPSRDYYMVGIPLTVAFDNTGSLLDAVKGQRLTVSAAPYTGEYEGDFSILKSRLDAEAFIPLVGEDTWVLALRGVVGVIGGENSDKIPPSARFYSGGGGSVRGYEYQSIGPRNENDKPLGGGSLVEVSVENRWKITQEWGVVAFVDGGSAYENVFEDTGQEIRWGAGVGLRYYTVIGPIRADIATPLNPRKDDDDLQFYISIGQSF